MMKLRAQKEQDIHKYANCSLHYTILSYNWGIASIFNISMCGYMKGSGIKLEFPVLDLTKVWNFLLCVHNTLYIFFNTWPWAIEMMTEGSSKDLLLGSGGKHQTRFVVVVNKITHIYLLVLFISIILSMVESNSDLRPFIFVLYW